VHGGIFVQTYEPTTGTAVGHYSDGTGRYAEGGIAVVDHHYGRGRTRLVGTFPGYGHFHRPSLGSRGFFAGLAAWAKVQPHAHTATPGMVTRLHTSDSATFLWVVSHHREDASVLVELGGRWGPFREARARWGHGHVPVSGRHLRLEIDGRDAAVLELR
jgi:beta-galactosidase